MREIEADLVDSIIFDLKRAFGEVRFLEIGVFAGDTMRGVCRKAAEIQCPFKCAGVDFEQWRPNPCPDPNYEFYAGDTMDMWQRVQGKFNFLFIDGCHCSNHAGADFLNYSPFVNVGGFCLFHDTALPVGGAEQHRHAQNHAYAGQPDSFLGVRSAIRKLGLEQGYRTDWSFETELKADDGVMGMMLFKKQKELL